MNADIKAKWTAALRSEQLIQCQHALQRGYPAVAYCCLGVLAQLVAPKDLLLYSDVKAAGVRDDVASQLMALNDDEGKTFPEIADWIDLHIPVTS